MDISQNDISQGPIKRAEIHCTNIWYQQSFISLKILHYNSLHFAFFLSIRCKDASFADQPKEPEMQIGLPTDVKHVAHIGWDGPSSADPSWVISVFLSHCLKQLIL